MISRVRTFCVAFLVFVVAAAGGVFAAETLLCEIRPLARAGWIPPQILLQFSPGKSRAEVYDGNIEQMHGKPVPAILSRRSTETVDLNWRVSNLHTSDGELPVDVEFRAVVNLRNMKMMLQANQLSGTSNTARGAGVCNPEENLIIEKM